MLWLNKLIYKKKKDVCFSWLLFLNASQLSPHSSRNNGLKVNRQVGYEASYFSKHTGRKGGRERAGLLSWKLNIKSCEACIAKYGDPSSATINVAFSQRQDWKTILLEHPLIQVSQFPLVLPDRAGEL